VTDDVSTPLHPRAQRYARLAKYTMTGIFNERRMRELSTCVSLGMMSIHEMREQMGRLSSGS
jgi:hypothetical protein